MTNAAFAVRLGAVGVVVAPISFLSACGARTPEKGADVDMTCATDATPDEALTFSPPGHHTVDSSSGPGKNYGSAACPNQYLLEIDFPTASGLYLSGFWSPTVGSASACNYAATMTVFGRRSGTSAWELDDQVMTHSVLDTGVCTVVITSRQHALPAGADPSSPDGYVPANQYDAVRVAVVATDSAANQVPVLVDFFYPTP